jgi:hypothetical protein
LGTKAARIPPDGEQLEFVRNTKTGRVHIMCYGPESYWTSPARDEMDPRAVAVLNWVAQPRRMLCGAKLLVGADDRLPAAWATGDHFDDDDLCIACVTALGDQQWRAFHADNRGPFGRDVYEQEER